MSRRILFFFVNHCQLKEKALTNRMLKVELVSGIVKQTRDMSYDDGRNRRILGELQK